MGSYRCIGCGDYYRRPEHRRIGLSAVCSEACLDASASRRNHPAGRSTTSKKSPADIPPAVRLAVFARDHGRCRYCGTREGLHLHHVAYRSQGGAHEVQNLVSLCHRHHAVVHADKRRYQPVLRALLWLEYAEQRHLSVIKVEELLAVS